MLRSRQKKRILANVTFSFTFHRENDAVTNSENKGTRASRKSPL